MLKALKVRIYPSKEQQSHFARAKGSCSLGVESVSCYYVADLQTNWERYLCVNNEETDTSLEKGASVAQRMLLAMPPIFYAESVDSFYQFL